MQHKSIECYLSEIDQITAFVAIFGQKTGNKLQYVVNNGGQNNVIIAKKSNFIHRFEIAHKTAFFSTRIMAPVLFLQSDARFLRYGTTRYNPGVGHFSYQLPI